ncbi:MAG: transposase [Pseudomonadales bacterium]|nr:transposase [Pseudomonadales bacterium]
MFRPAQNAYIERFNGTYRAEVLNAHQFSTLHEARRVTQDCLRVYNEERTHSAIGLCHRWHSNGNGSNYSKVSNLDW